MRPLKRATEFLLGFVLFPIVLFLVLGVLIVISLTAFAAYVGGLLAAWLLVAYLVPLAAGIFTPNDLVAAVKWRRKPTFEGEALCEKRRIRVVWKPKPRESNDLTPQMRLPVYESSRWADW